MEHDLTAEEWCRLIRRRPALYIGGAEEFGLSMFLEHLLLLGFQAGRLGRVRDISVDLLADGGCRLSFDGSPWPLLPWTSPLASLERWFTVDALYPRRATVPDRAMPGIPSGIYCRDSEVYLGVINILSSRLDVVAWSRDQTWRCRYREGIAEEGVLPLAASEVASPGSESGLRITAIPDAAVFSASHRFSPSQVRERIQALSAFHAGVSWTLRDEAAGTEERFLRERGLEDLCAELSGTSLMRDPWAFEGQVEEVWLRGALGWKHRPGRGLSSWVNLLRCQEGGPHHRGFLVGMRRAFVARLATAQEAAQ